MSYHQTGIVTDANEYQKLAQRTARKDLEPKRRLAAAALGLTGEGGEAADLIKKHIAHDHDLDIDHMKKELGDVLYYVAELCTLLDVSMSEVMTGNIKKLEKRYPNGFSVERSKNRDKNDI